MLLLYLVGVLLPALRRRRRLKMAHPSKTQYSSDCSKNLRDIRRVAYFLVLIITSNSIPGIVDGLDHPQLLGRDGAVALWNFYLVTLPLTTSVAIIGILFIIHLKSRSIWTGILRYLYEVNPFFLYVLLVFIFVLGAGVSLFVSYGGVTASD